MDSTDSLEMVHQLAVPFQMLSGCIATEKNITWKLSVTFLGILMDRYFKENILLSKK